LRRGKKGGGKRSASAFCGLPRKEEKKVMAHIDCLERNFATERKKERRKRRKEKKEGGRKCTVHF